MAQRIAKLLGAAEVIGVDVEEYRLDFARQRVGSTIVNAREDDAVAFIRERTGGRGADCCIDAVGMESHRNLAQKVNALVHLQRGSMATLLASFDAVRRGGSVGVVGVYGTPFDNFPLHQFLDKGIKMQGGQAMVHEAIDLLMEHVRSGRLRADDLITHVLPLDEAPYAYGIFNRKEDGCVKCVLKP
jgi:alcohol dehydrogenase